MAKSYLDSLLDSLPGTSSPSPDTAFPQLPSTLGSAGFPTPTLSPTAPAPSSSPSPELDALLAGLPGEGQPQEEEGASLLDRASDVGIWALRGAIGIPEQAVGLADMVTGGHAGKALEEVGFAPGRAKDILAAHYSPAHQAAKEKVREAEGPIDTAIAAIQNPSTIAGAVIESFPMLLGGAGVARGLGALGMKGLGRAAIGEGVVAAGSAAEGIRQQTAEGLLSPGQSLAAAATGVGTAALGRLGGKLAKEWGFADVDSLFAGAARDPAVARGIAKQVLYGAVTEGGLEELPQSVQEQVLQNAALGRELDEGVDQAAVFGALTGAAMGGGANLVSGMLPGPSPEPPPAPEPRMGGEYEGPPPAPLQPGEEGYMPPPEETGFYVYPEPRGVTETGFEVLPEPPLPPPAEPPLPPPAPEVWQGGPPAEGMAPPALGGRTQQEVIAEQMAARGVPEVWGGEETPPPAAPPETPPAPPAPTPIAVPPVENVTAFHGSPRTDLTAFNPDVPGPKGDSSVLGTFFSLDSLGAQHYAGKSGRTYETKLAGKFYTLPQEEFQALGSRADFRALRQRLIAEGYDGVKIPHLNEVAMWNSDAMPISPAAPAAPVAEPPSHVKPPVLAEPAAAAAPEPPAEAAAEPAPPSEPAPAEEVAPPPPPAEPLPPTPPAEPPPAPGPSPEVTRISGKDYRVGEVVAEGPHKGKTVLEIGKDGAPILSKKGKGETPTPPAPPAEPPPPPAPPETPVSGEMRAPVARSESKPAEEIAKLKDELHRAEKLLLAASSRLTAANNQRARAKTESQLAKAEKEVKAAEVEHENAKALKVLRRDAYRAATAEKPYTGSKEQTDKIFESIVDPSEPAPPSVKGTNKPDEAPPEPTPPAPEAAAEPAAEPPAFTRTTPRKGTPERNAIDARSEAIEAKSDDASARVSIAQNEYDKSKYGTPRRAKAEKARDKAWAERDALSAEEKASRAEKRKAYLEDLAEGPDEANRIAALAELNKLATTGKFQRATEAPGGDSYEKIKELARAEAKRQGIPEDRIEAVVVDAAAGISSTPGYHPTMAKAIEVANRTFEREAEKHTAEKTKNTVKEQTLEIRKLGLDRETTNRLIDDFTVSSSQKAAKPFEEVLAEAKELKAAKDKEESLKRRMSDEEYAKVRVVSAPPSAKANEKPHKTTGLTPSQARFLAEQTKLLNEGGPEAMEAQLPVRLKMGNFELLIRTPLAASAVHRAATGEPLPGIKGQMPSYTETSKNILEKGFEPIPKGRPRNLDELQTEVAAENAATIQMRKGGTLDAALEEVLKDSADRGVKLNEVTLREKAEEAKKRLARAASPSAFGVGYFQDYAIVGADLIHRGAKSLGEFTKQIVSTFGEGVRSAARSIYDAAQRIVARLRGQAEGAAAAPAAVGAEAPAEVVPTKPIRPIPPGAKPGEKVAPPAEPAGFNPRETGPAEVPKATPAQKEAMFEAGRTEGGEPITGKPSPTKEDEPEFDINVGKSSVNPETQQFLARMVEAAPERYGKTEEGARGEKRSWDSVRAWATMHGWSEAELKRSFTQKGGFLSDVEMERANQLREHHREKYLEHYDKYEKLKAAGRGEEAELSLDKAKAEAAQIDALQYALTHSKSEAARALAYAARLAEGLTAEERYVARTFKGFKGQEALYRQMAEAARKKDYRRVNEITRELHKPTLMEQIVEGWKLGLLTGPPTQIVNTASTGAKVVGIDPFEAAFAGVLDSILHPKDRSRYMSEGKAMLRGAWAAKSKAWTEMKLGLDKILDGSYEDWAAGEEIAGRGRDGGKFGPQGGKIGGKFGRSYRSVYHLMGITDQFWKDIAGSQAVYRIAHRRGRQAGHAGDALESFTMDFVRQYAGKELPDQGEIAEMVRKAELLGTYNMPLKEGEGFIPGIGRIVGQATEQYPILGFIAPFIQTPVNLAGETIARTPIGIYRGVKAAMKGNLEKGEDVEMLAKGLAGAALMSMMYILMRTGEVEVSGGGPTDPDKKQNLIDTGWQPYSVKFGDSWVSYQRFDPLSSLIGFVADWNEAKNAKSFAEGVEKAYSSIGQNLTNKTFLAGATQFAGMLHNPARQFKPWLKQFEGSLVPAVVGRAAAATDSTVRVADPYKRKYGVPEPILARVPGASKLLDARKTPTGEERQRAGGAVARFLSPFPISEEKKTFEADVQREFDRLQYVPGQPKREQRLPGGKTIELDDREYGILQSAYVDAARQASKVIKTARYKRLDPDKQQDELENVYNIARRRARMLLFQDPRYRRRAARVRDGQEG